MVTTSTSEEYEQASQLQIINSKVSFLFKEVMGKVFVKFGDQKFGPYAQATGLQKYKEGIAYFASEDKTWAAYVDGQKVTDFLLDMAPPIIEHQGRPTMAAKDAEGWKILCQDKFLTSAYPGMLRLRKQGDSIICAVRKPDQKMCLLTIAENAEEGPTYQKLGTPVVVRGKVAYPAQKSDSVQLIVYDGQEMTPYEEIGRVLSIKDRLVYTARKGEDEWYVISEAKEYGPHPIIGMIIEHDNGIAYAAMDPNKPGWEVYQDGELATDFKLQSPGIGWLADLKGKLSYVFVNKRQWCSVRFGSDVLPKEFLAVKYLTPFKDKIAFAAGLGRDVPRWKISIQGEEVSDEFADILALTHNDDTLFALAVKPNRRCVIVTLKE